MSSLRVLVVDDDPVSRELALRMLTRHGCHADGAGNGQAALDAHRAARYDLILMDCDMPVLDGFAATMQLRAEEQGQRTPVVALTADAGQEQQCLRAGMDALLSKPLHPHSLGALLGQWFAAGSPERAPEDELEAVRDMYGEDFCSLAALYREDGPPRLAALRRAQAESDAVKLAKVAHTLGGSSASIGATGLASMCREFELRMKAGLLDDSDQRLRAIEHEYARVSDKLQTLLGP